MPEQIGGVFQARHKPCGLDLGKINLVSFYRRTCALSQHLDNQNNPTVQIHRAGQIQSVRQTVCKRR